ncbi:hypothetical protein D3C81_2129860 [compost metagenome]
MQVHTHFAGAACYHVAGKFNVLCIHRHFIVGQINRLAGIFFTQRLKARQKTRVLGRNAVVVLPQIIAFGINRDKKRRFSHTLGT